MADLQIKDVDHKKNSLQRRTVAVLALVCAVALGGFVFLSSPLSQKVLGFRVSSLGSFAFQDVNLKTESDQPVLNCIKAPCPGDDTTKPEPLKVLYPSGGETWSLGETQKIKWVIPVQTDPSFAAYTVNISLVSRPACLDANPPCKIMEPAPYIIAEKEANDGEFEWTIPKDLPEQFIGETKVKVTINDAGEQAISGAIKITKTTATTGTFQVTSPNGGETWKSGNSYKIAWVFSDPTMASIRANTMTISLNPVQVNCLNSVKDCGVLTKEPYIIASNVTNTGSYEWTIPKDFNSIYAGQNQIVIKVNNTDKTAASNIFNLEVSQPSGSDLQISTDSMSSGKVGSNYSAQFKASGGTSPYTWSASIAQYQGDYKIDSATGEFAAKPQRVGNYRVTINVTDSNNIRANSVSRTYLWNVTGADVSTPHPNGSLILNIKGSPTGVWLIENGFVRPFPTAEVFMSHGYKWSSIVKGNSGDEGLPVGEGFTLAPGALITPSGSGKMCLVYSGLTYRCFSTYIVFKRMGYRTSTAYQVSPKYLENVGYRELEPINEVIAHPAGTDVSYNGTIYWISDRVRIPYPSVSVYNTWHTFNNDFSRVVSANQFDLDIVVSDIMRPRTVGQ